MLTLTCRTFSAALLGLQAAAAIVGIVAERWNGSCRRELIDNMIVLSDVHLRRLFQDYISYYHADRIHDSLEKDSPVIRPVSHKPDQSARLVSLPRIGGLHHRYDWQLAA